MINKSSDVFNIVLQFSVASVINIVLVLHVVGTNILKLKINK
jgi:hypothetical protein